MLFAVVCSPAADAASGPLSGFNPASLADGRGAVFFDGRTFWADTALPVRPLVQDDWGGPFTPGEDNTALAFWKADAGVYGSGWRLAVFHRGELLIETNRDTVEFLRMVELRQSLPVGSVYEVDFTVDGFSAKGLEVSRGFALDPLVKGLSAGVTARFMAGDKVQDGRITGEVTVTSPTTYDFNLLLDYVYDRNYIYNRVDTVRGTGAGYSFDLGLKYTTGTRFTAQLLFRDLLGRMYWNDSPYTNAEAVSQVISLDEAGYQVYKPTIRGFEGSRDYTQNIALKTDITLSCTAGPFTLTPVVNILGESFFYWVFLGYALLDDMLLTAGYNTNFQSVSAGLSYKNTRLEFYASDLDLDKSTSVGVRASLAYHW